MVWNVSKNKEILNGKKTLNKRICIRQLVVNILQTMPNFAKLSVSFCDKTKKSDFMKQNKR